MKKINKIQFSKETFSEKLVIIVKQANKEKKKIDE